MTDNIRSRLERLERAVGSQITPERLAVQARHEKRMTELIVFIDAAIPDRRECIAHHVAQIMGLPDSKAYRDLLQRQPLEDIARERYGEDWEANLETTAAAAAVHYEAAHGPDWQGKFVAIWQGDAFTPQECRN